MSELELPSIKSSTSTIILGDPEPDFLQGVSWKTLGPFNSIEGCLSGEQVGFGGRNPFRPEDDLANEEKAKD